MKEYMVVEKGPLVKLRSQMSALIGDVDKLLNGGVGTLSFSEQEVHEVVPKSEGKPKAHRIGGFRDILFAHAPGGEFTAREATEALQGKYKFATKNRQIDSVRNALKHDGRFEELPNGKFRRKEFQLAQQ